MFFFVCCLLATFLATPARTQSTSTCAARTTLSECESSPGRSSTTTTTTTSESPCQCFWRESTAAALLTTTTTTISATPTSTSVRTCADFPCDLCIANRTCTWCEATGFGATTSVCSTRSKGCSLGFRSSFSCPRTTTSRSTTSSSSSSSASTATAAPTSIFTPSSSTASSFSTSDSTDGSSSSSTITTSISSSSDSTTTTPTTTTTAPRNRKCFERMGRTDCEQGNCVNSLTGNTIPCVWNATANRCGGTCRLQCSDITSNCLFFALFTLTTCPDGTPCQSDPQRGTGPCAPCNNVTTTSTTSSPPPPTIKKRQLPGVCECAPSTLPVDIVSMSDTADLVGDTDSTPIIAGAVAGGVVLLLLCALVLWCVLARRKRDHQVSSADDKEQWTARSERPASQYGIVPLSSSPQGSKSSAGDLDAREYASSSPEPLEYGVIAATPSTGSGEYMLMPTNHSR